jgi:hypothetical protein
VVNKISDPVIIIIFSLCLCKWTRIFDQSVWEVSYIAILFSISLNGIMVSSSIISLQDFEIGGVTQNVLLTHWNDPNGYLLFVSFLLFIRRKRFPGLENCNRFFVYIEDIF